MGWDMGWHVDDAHQSVHDDGRTLRPFEIGEPLNDPDEDPYVPPPIHPNSLLLSGPPLRMTSVFRYSGDKLRGEFLHLHRRPYAVTKWESLYSSIFGTGVRGTRINDYEDGVEASFTPIIDESYRVVGHLGWIDIGQICMRKFTDAEGTGTALHLEKARLSEEHRQFVWRLDHPSGLRLPPGLLKPATNSPPPRQPPPCRPSPTSPLLKPNIDWDTFLRAPFKDGSEEQRHQKNLNFFLKAGGKALVGREFAKALLESERYDLYEFTGYRCLALVSPDGHLQGVFGIEKIPYVSVNDRTMAPVFKVIDIALTILMIIDIATISVALIRAGRLLGEIMIRALAVTLDREAKAALDLALREAMRDATGAELKAARGAAPGDGPPLLSADELNKFVPQEKPGMGESRRLNPNERAGAMKIIDVLQKMRGAPDLDKQIAQMLEDLGKDVAKRNTFKKRLTEIAKKEKIAKMLKDLGNEKLGQEKFINELTEIAKKDEQIARMLKGLREGGDGKKFMNELTEFAKKVEEPPPWEFIKELTAKELEHGKLAQQGWKEIYMTPAGVGALNQMRVLFRNIAGRLEVKLLQMH